MVVPFYYYKTAIYLVKKKPFSFMSHCFLKNILGTLAGSLGDVTEPAAVLVHLAALWYQRKTDLRGGED